MAIVATPIRGVERSDTFDLSGLVAVLFFLDVSGNYAAGGEVIAAPNLKTILKRTGAGELYRVTIDVKAGYVFEYDYTNDKVLVEFGDNNNAADGPGIEIPVAAYPAALSGLTGINRIRGMALGR